MVEDWKTKKKIVIKSPGILDLYFPSIFLVFSAFLPFKAVFFLPIRALFDQHCLMLMKIDPKLYFTHFNPF